jgi:hypothetical protein
VRFLFIFGFEPSWRNQKSGMSTKGRSKMEVIPAPQNKLANFVNTILRYLIKGGKDVAKAFIVAEVPFFGMPVVSQLVDGALNFVSGYIYREGALTATFFIIDAQTYREEKSFSEAAKRLLEVQERTGGDNEEYRRAREEARQRLGDLIRWDGIAKP